MVISGSIASALTEAGVNPTVIARQLHANRTSRYKVIALDCDETLWRGVCGEDGPQGIGLDAGHLALQKFMLAQRESGMLLCLCSNGSSAAATPSKAKRP